MRVALLGSANRSTWLEARVIDRTIGMYATLSRVCSLKVRSYPSVNPLLKARSCPRKVLAAKSS
jgi:hypothetical protein